MNVYCKHKAIKNVVDTKKNHQFFDSFDFAILALGCSNDDLSKISY